MNSGLLSDSIKRLWDSSTLWCLEWSSSLRFWRFCSMISLRFSSSSCFSFIRSFFVLSSSSNSFCIFSFCFCHRFLRLILSFCFCSLRRLKKSFSSASSEFSFILDLSKRFWEVLIFPMLNKSAEWFRLETSINKVWLCTFYFKTKTQIDSWLN